MYQAGEFPRGSEEKNEWREPHQESLQLEHDILVYTHDIQAQLDLLEADIQSISKDTHPDTVETVRLLEDMKTLLRETEQHLHDEMVLFTGKPSEYVGEYIAVRHEAELQIPDNDRIISQIKREVEEIGKRRNDLVSHAIEIAEQQGKELVYENVHAHVLQDAELAHAIASLVDMFAQAKKQDASKWGYAKKQIDLLESEGLVRH